MGKSKNDRLEDCIRAIVREELERLLKEAGAPMMLGDITDPNHDLQPVSLLFEGLGVYWYELHCCHNPSDNSHGAGHPHIGVSASSTEQTTIACGGPKSFNGFKGRKHESISIPDAKGNDFGVFWGEEGIGTKKRVGTKKVAVGAGVKEKSKTRIRIVADKNKLAKAAGLEDEEFDLYELESSSKNVFHIAVNNVRSKEKCTDVEIVKVSGSNGNCFYLTLKVGKEELPTYLLRRKG